MKHRRETAALLLLCLAVGEGCTTLKEVPRGEYATKPERQNVRVETTEGLVYEFDYAQVQNDTLTGFRHRDTSGPIDELSTLQLPLDSVRALSVRGIDWYRTGFVSGGVLVAVVAAGLTVGHHDDSGSSSSGGTKGGTPGSN